MFKIYNIIKLHPPFLHARTKFMFLLRFMINAISKFMLFCKTYLGVTRKSLRNTCFYAKIAKHSMGNVIACSKLVHASKISIWLL